MKIPNRDYWRNEGARKVFTHSIQAEWLTDVDRDAPVLDFGCGYGRLTPILGQLGFTRVYGYDPSEPMIARAAQENPGADYTNNIEQLSGKYFDLVLCFALFTSCPTTGEQSQLASLINRLTRRGALLYISDYETDDNPRYIERYEQRQLDIYGCFKSGTALFRHHGPGHFDGLLPGWKNLQERTAAGKTLNGNEIKIHQYLYAKKQDNSAIRADMDKPRG